MENFNFFYQNQQSMLYPAFGQPPPPQNPPVAGFTDMGIPPPPPPLFTFDLQGARGQQPPPQGSKATQLNTHNDTSSAQAATNGKKAKRKAKGIKRKQAKANTKKMDTNVPPPAATTSAPGTHPVQHARSPIVPPSAQSGGIPTPSPLYLIQASQPPTRLDRPRTILVVMDLNGTLLFRPDRRRSHHFVQRPHAGPFMEYLIDTFAVAVWSSARPANVSIMCDALLAPAHRARLIAVWGRDKFGLSTEDYNQRVQCYKRLEVLWADPAIQASHPQAAIGDHWDQTNTVLVDDSLEKARTEPHNLLRIPEFFGEAQESGDVLPQIHDYLNELAWQADISRYIHANPFSLDPEYKLPSVDETQ